MCSKCNEPKDSTLLDAIGTMEGVEGVHSSCHSNRLRNYLKPPDTATAPESSALTSVYKRRKFQKKPMTLVLPHVSAESISLEKGLVYWRRKHYNPDVVFPARVSEDASINSELFGTPASSSGSENPSLSMEKHTENTASHGPEGLGSCMSEVKCSDELVLKNVEAIDGCLNEHHSSVIKGIGDKIVELQSAVYRRRKHYTPAVIVPTGVLETVLPSAELSGHQACSLRSTNPSLDVEKCTDHKDPYEPEGMKSCVSVVGCGDEPALAHAEASDGYLKEQLGTVVKGIGENNVELPSAVYRRRKHYNPVVVVPTGALETLLPSSELSGDEAFSPRPKNSILAAERHTHHNASEGLNSRVSTVICSDGPVLTNAEAGDGCLNKQLRSIVKGVEETDVELQSVYRRRKHYNPMVVVPNGVLESVPQSAELSGGRACFFRSKYPSFPLETNTDHEAAHKPNDVRSSIPVAICTNESFFTHAGAVDGCVNEQHGSDVKEDKNMDLCSTVYRRRKHYNPTVVFPTGVPTNVLPKSVLCRGHASSLSSANPPISTKKHIGVTGLNETEGGRSSLSLVICSNEPGSTHAGSIDRSSAEQHGFDVKGKGKNSVDLRRVVYWRRKHYNPAVLLNTGAVENVSSNAKLSGDHASSLMLENPSLGTEKHTDHLASHEIEGGRSSSSVVVCSDEPVLAHSEAIEKCLVEQHGSAAKCEGRKVVELYSVDDSCSSSMINMDAGSTSLNMEVYENGECSSSGAFVGELMEDDISEKDICISILKSNGLLSCLVPSGSCTIGEDIASSSGFGNSCSCNVCGLLGSTENMLICDQCEEAFHVSCCNPSMRKISFDEWSCPCCFKKKHKIMKQTNGPGSTAIQSALFRPTESKAKTCPIALMLKNSEAYATNVRIGKDFQAVVPCWSGPTKEYKGIDVSREPRELNPSYNRSTFHVLNSEQLPGCKTLTNWLQCQNVVVGAGERDGTICGKWRRAPLFEVQTDKWDCFSCLFWNPTHADCAAPQELETVEVLKQLKYIEMLRPRLEAKKRKLDAAKLNHPQGH